MADETMQEKLTRLRGTANQNAAAPQTNEAPKSDAEQSKAGPDPNAARVAVNENAAKVDPMNPTKDGQINRPEGVVDPKLPSTFDEPGAMPNRGIEPHTVQVADGIRGNQETLPYQQRNMAAEAGKALVSSEGNVHKESDFREELTRMHDEIEKLTKEYTEGGLQVSDFPASYHQLTNRYRIRAAALNSRVGGMGPEEAKVMQENKEMQIRMEQKLTEARLADARAVEERKKVG